MAIVTRSGSELPALARSLAAAEVPVSGGAVRTALRDAPGSAGVRVGAETDARSPLDAWLSLLFGPGRSAD